MDESLSCRASQKKFEKQQLRPEKSYFFYSLLKVHQCVQIWIFIEMPHLPPKIVPIDVLITPFFGRFC